MFIVFLRNICWTLFRMDYAASRLCKEEIRLPNETAACIYRTNKFSFRGLFLLIPVLLRLITPWLAFLNSNNDVIVVVVLDGKDDDLYILILSVSRPCCVSNGSSTIGEWDAVPIKKFSSPFGILFRIRRCINKYIRDFRAFFSCLFTRLFALVRASYTCRCFAAASRVNTR